MGPNVQRQVDRLVRDIHHHLVQSLLFKGHGPDKIYARKLLAKLRAQPPWPLR